MDVRKDSAMVRKIAIHQPNLVPWLPFFEKIRSVDLFVILSHCQFTSENYQNRFRANSNWFTMSIVRDGHMRLIKDKRYLKPHEDWKRIKKSWPKLEMFDEHISNSLFLTNMGIIKQACKFLGIETEIVTDYETHLRGNDRLIDICKTFGAQKYLSGIGANKYLDKHLFERAGIDVEIQSERTYQRSLAEIL